MELIGKTLGQYRIVEKVGQGGMATVFKAYQPSLDRFVAIKILSAQHAQTPGYRKRFFQEAKAVASLSHPNILPVYDAGMEDDLSYLVMKYVPDHSVRDIMGQPMPLVTISRLIEQIAGALDHAHESGIIHRDIKPANLLLQGEWVFLTDFGIAKIVEGSVALTSTGELMGTPAYISPEQATAKPIDHRSDIYSLGVVLYEMVTGRVPFKGETPYGVIFMHVHDPLPMPRSYRPDLPEDVERVILKAMAKSPEHRYNRAGELAEALRDAVASAGSEVSYETIPIEKPAKPQGPEELRPHTHAARTPQSAASEPTDSAPSSTVKPRSINRMIFPGAAALLVLLGSILAFHYVYHISRYGPIATVQIESKPAGAQVSVDGISRGISPISLDLPLGEHKFGMTLPGYEEWEQAIRIEEQKGYEVRAELKQTIATTTLKIDTIPGGGKTTGAGWEEELRGLYLTGKRDLENKNYQAAFQSFSNAAEKGHKESQNEIGYMYRHGLGVKQSDEESAEWYRKAAEQGLAEAQNNLGVMYLKGEGVKKSARVAFLWFEKAAEQGDSRGQFHVATMYRMGIGVNPDETKALEWYRKAAEQGHEQAKEALKAAAKEAK